MTQSLISGPKVTLPVTNLPGPKPGGLPVPGGFKLPTPNLTTNSEKVLNSFY